MKKIHVLHHKDGDHLSVSEIPMLAFIFESIVSRIPLWLIGYPLWNYLLVWISKFDIELYKVPIESGCVASQALWGRAHDICWKKNCPMAEEVSHA